MDNFKGFINEVTRRTTGGGAMYTATDPATNAATAAAIVGFYSGVIITTTTTGNSQTLGTPLDATAGRVFTVVNNDTSTNSFPVVGGGTFTVTPGESQSFIWDGSSWGPTDLGITAIPVPVTQGGTGVATLTDHGILLGSGTDAITPMTALAAGEIVVGVGGADPHALAAGATTKILVGGGAADPVWTEATGSGAPVRATSPTLVTPVLGTPASGDLQNCTAATTTTKGVTVYSGTTKAVAGTDTASAMTPADVAAAVAIQTNQKQPTQAIHLTAAASGSSGIQGADSVHLNAGTGNFSWTGEVSQMDWTPSADQIIAQKHDGSNGWILKLLTTGVLRLTINATNYDSTAANTLTNATMAKLGFSVTRETAAVAGVVRFAIDGKQLGADVAITAGAPTTVTNTALMYTMGTSAVRTAGRVSNSTFWNRALTIAEHQDWVIYGVAFADKWGSQTAKYTSDFSAGEDGWAAIQGDVAGNIDSIGGEDNWLRFTTDTDPAAHNAIKSITMLPNKKYNLSFKYYIPSTNSNFLQIVLCDILGEYLVSFTGSTMETPLTVTDAATNVSINFVSGAANGFRIYTPHGAGDVDPGGDDVFYIKDFVLTELGATLALEPEGINETNWQDSSTNNLDATYPATGWSLTRKVPTATTTEKGFAELATNAEALAGTDTARIITPDDLKYVLDRRIQQYYGVSWDESADTYVRTGSTAGQACGMTLADAFLPVHRRMRGCLVADDGTVNYYLCATDWTKKEDGITASDLTGTDGQVMVEIPKFWYRYGYSGTTHTWEVSPVPLTGFKVHEAFLSDTTEKDYLYVGAYEACLYDVSASKYVGQCHQTSVSAVFATSDDSITIATRTGWATTLAVGQKLVITGTSNNNTTVTVKTIESATKITVDENLTDETAATTVIETQTDVTDTTGDKLCSVSGVCPITGGSTNGTRAHFRTWAENRGGGKAANDAATVQWIQLYGDANSALQLLYLTEYASFYSQSVLGYGIAAVADWAAYNDYNPIAKSGNGNAIGNISGCTATFAITTGAGATSVYLKYRGIENLYGHIWKFVDGFKVNDNIPYLCNNFANFSDAESTTNYTNPTDVNGAAITMHNADGYQGTLELTGRAFMPASLTGGSASAKITDYYYQAAGWRVVIFGGAAYNGASDGAFCLYAADALADVSRTSGARLVLRK